MKHFIRIRKRKRLTIIIFIIAVVSVYLFLMIPGGESLDITGSEEFERSFCNRGGTYGIAVDEVEQYFISNDSDCGLIDTLFAVTDSIRKEINNKPFYKDDSIFDSLKQNFLFLASLVSKCNYRFSDLVALQTGISNSMKKQFRGRIFNSERFGIIYENLLASKIAVEEAIIAQTDTNYISRLRGIDEPSASPLAREAGIFLRSGDIILSLAEELLQNILLFKRELKSSFSNVSLVYVEDTTRSAFVMSSNTRTGAEIRSIEEFLNKSNRFLILRMSAQDTLILVDSLIPHKAAKFAFDEISSTPRGMAGNKIRYDYENEVDNDEKFSNAELVQYYYSLLGIDLNVDNRSRREGIDLSPALYEFHPSLVEVFEVRSHSGIIQERINEISICSLIQKLRDKEFEEQNIYLLPAARIIKLYSLILENFNKEGPIPAGMPAGEALKLWILKNEYEKIRGEVEEFVNDFRSRNGRLPRLWEMKK